MNLMSTSLNTELNDFSGSYPAKNKEKAGLFGRSLFENIRNVGESAKALQQTSTRHAGIALWEREMKIQKEQFGLDLYPLMERNRSMGQDGGGETEPHVVEVFRNCVSDMSKFSEQRKFLQTDLLKTTKPKTLSYQVSMESTASVESPVLQDPSTKSWLQVRMQQKLQQAKDAMEKTQSTSRIRAQLTALEKEMTDRRKKFGIEMFEVMAYMVDNYEPRDPKIHQLFTATKKEISIPLAKAMQAEKEIHDVRTNGEIVLSHSDIHNFIASTPTCWEMLHVNIGIPEEECKLVAYRVSLELASGINGEDSRVATISKKQFQKFQKEYIEDPKGSQEFFHRCVFAAFDKDSDGVLDMEEIDTFLDTFYVTGSIFQGDERLPEKETLKNVILSELNKNSDGLFNFDEIRSIISGSAERRNLQN